VSAYHWRGAIEGIKAWQRTWRSLSGAVQTMPPPPREGSEFAQAECVLVTGFWPGGGAMP